MELRPIGDTGIRVSSVALGCWPIAGMTSVNVNDADSLATIRACFDLGINHLDTAYIYGAGGESEKLIARALGQRRDEIVIATKCGLHWDAEGERIQDAKPETLRRECEESLQRLGTDRVELLYLHAPDPGTPLAESAGALKGLMDHGRARAFGASNFTAGQLAEFHAVCPLAAYQPPYNMLQRQIEADVLPWCRANNVSVLVYWPLLKGFLAGKLARDHVFAPGDGRGKYVTFEGEEWRKNHDFLDRLRDVAAETGKTVAQVVINWTIHQPGITVALCGAKRDHQIRETAGAMGWKLSPQQLAIIDQALKDRGTPLAETPI